MSKEPIPDAEDAQVLGALRVLEVEVDLTEARSAILIRLDGQRVGGPQSTVRLVLSPPAARQLSRDLRTKVKQYLRSWETEESK